MHGILNRVLNSVSVAAPTDIEEVSFCTLGTEFELMKMFCTHPVEILASSLTSRVTKNIQSRCVAWRGEAELRTAMKF